MKLAIVSDAIYPYNKGGKEKRIYEITTRLAKKGYDIHIYTMQWWKGEKIKKENGVTLHSISKLYPLYSGKRRSIRQAVLFSIACLKLLKEDFDILEADHMPHLVLFPLKLVSLIKRKKFFATWNEVWGKDYWKEYLGKMGILAYIIEKISIMLPDSIISISKHTTGKLKNEFKALTPIYTIPVGIDYEYIKNITPSKKTSDILYAGRLLSHKHIDYLIGSVSLLKSKYQNITCFIIGKGPEENKLKELVKKFKLQNNVIFYDFFDNHKNIYSLMKSSKVFVFPSTREGFGLVALEANACGIPVITTNHKENAAKDLIENGKNGFIVDLNENKIAEKITNYLGQKDNDNTYVSFVKEYNWDNISSKIDHVYKQ